MPEQLHAPWRMAYIRSLEKDPVAADPLARRHGGCFLCAAGDVDAALREFGEEPAAARRRRLVVWSGLHTVCVVNRYPYTSGHLMVAPRRHVAELDQLDAETSRELHEATLRAIRVLRDLMNPQGFNIGINLGSAAGAGVPGHLHQHVVPRWSGDANFMSVVGNVHVVPEMPETLLDALRERLTP